MKEFALALFLVIAFSSAVITACYWVESKGCDQKTVSFEYHKFGFFSGCMVVHQGRWFPLDNIRGFDDRD